MARRTLVARLEELLAEHRATREEFRAECHARDEQWRREFDAKYGLPQRRGSASLEGALANDRAVTREMLLELREGREMLIDIQHGIRSNTEGLLQILDELRREDGPGTAKA